MAIIKKKILMIEMVEFRKKLHATITTRKISLK